MQNETKITCRKCGHTFNLEEVYKQELEIKINQDFDKKVAEATKQAIENEKKNVAQQNDVYKRKIDELFNKNRELEQKNKLTQQLELQVTELQNYNKKIQSDLDIEIRRAVLNKEKELQKEKENERHELKKLYEDRQKNSEEQIRKEIEEKIKLQSQNEMNKKENELEQKYLLELKIKDEQLLQANKKAEELTKNLNQVSMQVQGEAQEKLLSERLKEMFIYDDFVTKTTGKEESDIEQKIYENGKYCGKIVYESKNTKAFNPDWIAKLKKDGQNANANCSVLITQTMPSSNNKLHQVDNIWICPINNFEIVAMTLRSGLIGVSKQKIINENKNDKMIQLYNFMSSSEFQNYMDGVFMSIQKLRDSYEQEQKALQKIWKQREKEFINIYDNGAAFIGAVKGISGIDTALFELPGQSNLLE